MFKVTEHKCQRCDEVLTRVNSQPQHRLLLFVCRKCNLKHYITIDNRFSHTNEGTENAVYIPDFAAQFTSERAVAGEVLGRLQA